MWFWVKSQLNQRHAVQPILSGSDLSAAGWRHLQQARRLLEKLLVVREQTGKGLLKGLRVQH